MDLAPQIAAAGYTSIWLPPPSDAVSPQGYLPRDLYCLDSKYGTEKELRDCIKELQRWNLKVIADIVINHRCAHKQVRVTCGPHDCLTLAARRGVGYAGRTRVCSGCVVCDARWVGVHLATAPRVALISQAAAMWHLVTSLVCRMRRGGGTSLGAGWHGTRARSAATTKSTPAKGTTRLARTTPPRPTSTTRRRASAQYGACAHAQSCSRNTQLCCVAALIDCLALPAAAPA